MNKFLTLKNKLISSKRQSQKIDEQQLLKIFKAKSSVGQLNHQIGAKIKAKVNKLKQQDYKLQYTILYPSQSPINQTKAFKRNGLNNQIQNINTMNFLKNTLKVHQNHQENVIQTTKNVTFPSYDNDIANTIKKQTSTFASDSNFAKILQIMTEINKLQKLKFSDEYAKDLISREIKQKLKQVKYLISHIQDDSQKSLIDFYNEQSYSQNSPDSFNSQNSNQTYQNHTQRQAYQLDESNNCYQQISINYRRVSQAQSQQTDIIPQDEEQQNNIKLSPINQSGLQHFYNQDYQQGYYQSPRRHDKNIVHLFSYQKSKCLDSQLSRISQRSSQYKSISDINREETNNFNESLQFKKIQYLLQTTEKKCQKEQSFAEVSQFSISHIQDDSFSANNVGKRKNARSKCHEQLQEMIHLLENKYKRKIKVGASNLMSNLNEALKDNKVHLRSKRLRTTNQ